MIKLNDIVDQVFFINLKRRKDRLEHIEKEFKRIKVDAKRFEAVDASKLKLEGLKKSRIGAIGAIKSHRELLEKSLKKKYNKICVFEDDVIFCDDFEERFDYYINNVPDNWDIMYLGCHFHCCATPVPTNKKHIFKIYESYGCFAMILNNERGLFNKILEVSKGENKPIDDYFHDDILPRKDINAYVFMPFFVKTLNTVSDIADTNESYSYDEVDKHFSNLMSEPSKFEFNKNELLKASLVGNLVEKEKEKIISYGPMNNCVSYLNSKDHFQIFMSGRLIFDSSTTDRSNLSFFQNHFTLYGKRFMYHGMSIKRKI